MNPIAVMFVVVPMPKTELKALSVLPEGYDILEDEFVFLSWLSCARLMKKVHSLEEPNRVSCQITKPRAASRQALLATLGFNEVARMHLLCFLCLYL